MKRDWLCHAAAALFSVLVVVPAILVFGDRSLPFEFVHAYFKPATVHANEDMMLAYTIKDVTKECDGEVKQYMVDADGTIYPLGTIPTVYRDSGEKSSRLIFRRKHVPEYKPGTTTPFAPGPAVYRAYPRYWCNPLQKLYPVEPERPMEVKFFVVPGHAPD